MKLLIVLITYQRLEYTQQTLRNLWKTIELPHYLVVIDNNSTDGTQKYLENLAKRYKIDKVILNPKNYYPGKACNIGWTEGLKDYPEATHLMRCDNDMHFEKGWDLRAEEYFKKVDRLGQLGLDFDGGENKVPQYYNGMGLIEWPSTVGGPNIIRREIFDSGARYDETPWPTTGSMVQEDVWFSRKLKEDGWLVGHMDERLSWTFADPSNYKDFPEYYKKSFSERGFTQRLKDVGLIE